MRTCIELMNRALPRGREADCSRHGDSRAWKRQLLFCSISWYTISIGGSLACGFKSHRLVQLYNYLFRSMGARASKSGLESFVSVVSR